MDTSTPVTIIGGYLGSGKTTLVNHLLRNANGVRLAVLVNDFGDLPIDADLIEAQKGDVISLSGGCVCCSYGDDLSAALISLKSNVGANEMPDHILIEASGVALPGAIGSTLTLLRAYQLEGIVVLADSTTVVQNAKARYIGDTIERQLSDADLVVLNKVDLLSSTELNDVASWMESNTHNARIVNASHSRLAPSLFFSLNDFALNHEEGKEESHQACQEKHHNVAAFKTFTLKLSQAVNTNELGELLSNKQYGIVRAKGFVPDESGKLKTLQLVGSRCSVTNAPENVRAGLIVIGLAHVVSEHRVLQDVNALVKA